jgi:hypothetical protein
MSDYSQLSVFTFVLKVQSLVCVCVCVCDLNGLLLGLAWRITVEARSDSRFCDRSLATIAGSNPADPSG